MTEPSVVILFASEDLELLTVEAVADQLRVSRAFVRLCVAAGCPTRSERLSAAELLHWLFGKYADVRKRAGFNPLPAVKGVAEPAQTQLKMANAVLTLLDFGVSRSSHVYEKEQLRRVASFVEAALDRL